MPKFFSSRPLPDFSPAEVVIARVSNCLENVSSVGKPRPAVIVRRSGAAVWVMGLTTNPSYGDGNSRIAVPNPKAIGLYGPGFLWGDRLTRVSVLDVAFRIGWADPELVGEIVALARGTAENKVSDLDSLAMHVAAAHAHGRLVPHTQ